MSTLTVAAETPRGVDGLRALLPGSDRWGYVAVVGAFALAMTAVLLSDAGGDTAVVSVVFGSLFGLLATPRYRAWWPRLAAPFGIVAIVTVTWTAGATSGFTTFLALILLQDALLHRARRVAVVFACCAAARLLPLTWVGTPVATELPRALLELGVWGLVAAAVVAAVGQLRRTVAAMARSEQRFTSLVQATGAAVWFCDPDGRVLDGNDASVELTGWPTEALLGRTLRRVAPPERRDADREHWQGAMAGETQFFETELLRRDGERRTIDVTLLPLSLGEAHGGFIAVADDITAVAQARVDAARTEERYRLLAENARVGIYSAVTAPEPQLEYVNATLEEMTGVPAAVWFENPRTARRYMHPDDIDAVLERRRGPAEDGSSPMIYRWLHPDGSLRWHEALEVPVRDAQGEVVGIHGIVTDITDHVREQERTAEALSKEQLAVERLERLHELKTTFLQSVSHELRTPLTSVLGFTRTIRDHGDRLEAPRLAMLLERAIANAEKLERLLRDLLDVDRLERGAATLTRQDQDLSELVHRVVDELETGRDRLELDLDPVTLEVDGPKVERIVENLIHNALRHTPAHTVVTVTVRRLAAGAELVVADRGPGVPDDLKERLFEPFEQGRASATAASPGTGIGLTLVARFAELHGGTAEILDRVGGGAAFRVLIPAAAGTPRSAEAGEEVPLLSHA
ncbi:MAG: PAS domain S-box protein [Actinobacteria bacterium]|nr:PAS domain S-box protein [Actinomycetota bacterium]